ncbi:MAG: asparagine synthase (glutamine-hydrolyzing) [Alphaproteobacteria bacterium]|nr:MAG: asparagine synthase (glutamine-hydrolyzing) [Alphaproteobacteria bacterium]
MCGIAGYFGHRKLDQSTIDKTLGLMKRRGPDSQDAQSIALSGDKGCVLLHSRLSIIDLGAHANQPFHYKDKILAFNGEIYNYIEVREMLVKKGHVFETKSDTEVLIHALDEWGKEALNILEGMWAFALLDTTKKTLLLSRDPFGEKPLFIYQPSPGELYFASEVKALAALAHKKFTPNINHICRFLVNGYKSIYKTPERFFVEVSDIPYASYLEINLDGRQEQRRYWYPKIDVNHDMSFDDAVAQTRELMIEAVRIRMRADIPIAFCMSGGIDSNSLISIAKRILNYDVHGFTILNTDNRYDEQDMIDISVSQLGVKNHGYAIPSDDFIPNMQALVKYHSSPVSTISFYLNWFLQSKISEEGYHVSVSGTAADEIFSGYFDHQLLYMYDIKNDAAQLTESVENWRRDIGPIVRNPFLQDPYAFIHNPFLRKHPYLKNDVYSTYLQQPWSEPFHEIYFRDGLLQNRMMNEIFHETTPVFMHQDDLNAMYHSVENRSPFLDRKLFEFAHSIPAQHLIKDGKAKMVLREAMRGIVPDPILDNKTKVGFNAPIHDLLDVDNKEVQDYLFADSPIWDVVKKGPIEEMVFNKNSPNSDSKFIFSFLGSKMFLEEFS